MGRQRTDRAAGSSPWNGQATVGEASMQAAELLGLEIALAKAEALAQVRQLTFAGAGLGAAAVAGMLGALSLAATAGLALALVVPGWAAALVVGGAAMLVAAAAGLWGVRRMSGMGQPMRLTAESLKRDLALLKDLRQ